MAGSPLRTPLRASRDSAGDLTCPWLRADGRGGDPSPDLRPQGFAAALHLVGGGPGLSGSAGLPSVSRPRVSDTCLSACSGRGARGGRAGCTLGRVPSFSSFQTMTSFPAEGVCRGETGSQHPRWASIPVLAVPSAHSHTPPSPAHTPPAGGGASGVRPPWAGPCFPARGRSPGPL